MDSENKKLNLTDYKEIWTPFCFLDESGTLDINSQPYFTVGMIIRNYNFNIHHHFKDGDEMKKAIGQ